MKKILIVEDDQSIQMFYQRILNMFGFEIAGIASDGDEAVLMFKLFKDKPEIILMDHRMPKKNGIEASKEILQIDHNVKIIFFSADDSIKEEAFSIGIYDFELKPFSIESMIAKIKLAFNSSNN
ncbi:MAG: response regulator [Candidatus Helarchaeota archaeon]